jgi:ankyrin repeat protein
MKALPLFLFFTSLLTRLKPSDAITQSNTNTSIVIKPKNITAFDLQLDAILNAPSMETYSQDDLSTAIIVSDPECIKQISESYFKPKLESAIQKMLFSAAQNGNDTFFNHLPEQITTNIANYQNKMQQSALIEAIKHNQTTIVNIIIAKDNRTITQVDADGFQAIHHAATYSNKDISKILLDNKAEVDALTNSSINSNFYQFTALHIAFAKDDKDFANALIDMGANVSYHLYNALINKQKYIIYKILDLENFALNQPCYAQQTALHLATEYDSPYAVVKLVENGASLTLKDSNNHTALMIAAKLGRGDILNYLLNAQIKQNTIKNDGNEALSLAAQNHRLDSVKFLAKKGFKANKAESQKINYKVFCAKARPKNIKEADQVHKNICQWLKHPKKMEFMENAIQVLKIGLHIAAAGLLIKSPEVHKIKTKIVDSFANLLLHKEVEVVVAAEVAKSIE